MKVIWALLKDRIGDMSASARCADEMKREFRDLKELLGYENLPGRRILRLELDARFYQSGKSKSASVRFDQSGVDVRLGGPEDVITRLTTDLKDFLVGIRGRFDRLARFDFVNLCFLLYLVGVVTLFSMFVAGYFGLTLQVSFPTIASIIFGLMFVFIAFGALFNRFRKRLFPVATFLIGHEKCRHETREKWQWILVGGTGFAMVSLPFTIAWKFLLR